MAWQRHEWHGLGEPTALTAGRSPKRKERNAPPPQAQSSASTFRRSFTHRGFSFPLLASSPAAAAPCSTSPSLPALLLPDGLHERSLQTLAPPGTRRTSAAPPIATAVSAARMRNAARHPLERSTATTTQWPWLRNQQGHSYHPGQRESPALSSVNPKSMKGSSGMR